MVRPPDRMRTAVTAQWPVEETIKFIGQNLQPGARWHTEYRVTSTGNTGTQTHDATATRRTSFNGHSAVEIEEGTTSDEWMLPGSGIVVKSFSRDADPTGAVVTIELTAGSFNGAPLRQ